MTLFIRLNSLPKQYGCMKYLLTIIAFFVSWVSAYSQVAYESIDIKTDNSYQYISSHNSFAKKKYANAVKWLESSIVDFDNTIVEEDAQSFKIVFKPEIVYEQSEAKSLFLVANVTVECRNDKFRIMFMNVNRKTVTKTCDYLTTASSLYKTRKYNADIEMKNYTRYKQLSAKRGLTRDEARALEGLKRYAKLTKNEVMEKEMKAYIDLQKAIAKFIDDVENAIKGD